MIVCGSRAHLQDEAVAKVSNKLITSILLIINEKRIQVLSFKKR